MTDAATPPPGRISMADLPWTMPPNAFALYPPFPWKAFNVRALAGDLRD